MAGASTSSSMSKFYQIEKLQGSNYLPWSLRIKMLLEKGGNWAVTEGSEPDPAKQPVPAGAPEPTDAEKAAWKKKEGPLLWSLYGLKQSPCQWNARFHSFMQSIHFRRLQNDVSVYLRHSGSQFVILALYVDDIILLATSLTAMNEIKRDLTATFHMSDGGELSYMLGMQILSHRPTHTMHITQAKFAEGIVKKFHTNLHKHCSTPLPLIRQGTQTLLNTNTTLWVHDPLSREYRSILGSIHYLVTCTRPDLAFASGMLSHYMHSPKHEHLMLAERLLQYINTTLNFGITFKRDNTSAGLQVTGYIDVDWATDKQSRHSIGGFAFLLSGGAISWKSKRQETMSLSSTESEYKAASEATKEALWIKNFLTELGFLVNVPMTIYSDSMSAIESSRKARQSDKLKHVDIANHFVREQVEAKTVALVYKPSKENAADIFTKSLSAPQHFKCARSLGMEFPE